jgi:chemotaxis protein methyltransferase CheR
MLGDDFQFLSEFLRRRSGLLLPSHKAHLIEGRLAPVAKRFGFRDVAALLRELAHARETLARAVTEAMTVNDSVFFRDRTVFDHLRATVLPRLLEARARIKRLRIWSAACAAGQEAYSLAMLLDDLGLVQKGWSIDLIATDLSSDLIARAEAGVYTDFEVQRGLSAGRLARHFAREGRSWRVNDSLRRMVSFGSFNLLDCYGWLHPIDIALCRNVLIFFEQKAKVQVVERVAEILAPDGTFVLGHSESIGGLNDSLLPADGPMGLYALRDAGAVLRFQPRAAIA